MIERLELILKSKNISPAQLADEIGIQRSGIYHIMKGRNKPGLDFILKLLGHYPEISPDWLLQGKGTMLKKVETEGNLKNVETAKVIRPEPGQLSAEIKENPLAVNISVREKKASRGLSRDISKIVIFYSDNSFEEYISREK